MRTLLFLVGFLFLQNANAQFSPGELTTAHKSLEGTNNCTKCHTLGAKVSEQKCLSCHKELNSRIKAQKGLHAHQSVKTKSCVSCHSEHHGRTFESVRFDTKTFEHAKTGYQLQGGHTKVSCRECHQAKNIANSTLKKNKNTYLGLQQKCTSCHDDYHQGTLSQSCLNCHTMNNFQKAPKFEHSKTSFPLKGKHLDVSCLECHKIGSKNDKKFQFFSDVAHVNCTSCHKDPHDNRFGQTCTKCHSEWSWKANTSIQQGFDHNKTAFPLIGLHQNVSCKSCHKGSYTDPLKHQKCMECHQDYHNGEFDKPNQPATDCKACHEVTQPFTFSSFDLIRHQSSSYPLTGAHQATSCLDCHKPTTNTKWSFKFNDKSCVSCHQNIHDGYLTEKFLPAQKCEVCHQTDSWSLVQFDHNQTKFKLTGQHGKTSCRSCHFKEGQDQLGRPIQEFSNKSQDCNKCHTDIHDGQFQNGTENNCAKCHTTEKDWPITNFDHQKTQFPLDGKHKEVSCARCHKPFQNSDGKSVTLYKIKQFECIDCHGS